MTNAPKNYNEFSNFYSTIGAFVIIIFLNQDMELRNASLLDRAKASTIDILLLIFLMYSFSIAFEFFENVSAHIRKWLMIFLFLIYEPLANSIGTTFGNYMMDIRVRKAKDELKNLNIFQSFFRYIFKILFGWFSFVTIFFNKRNRAIHDFVGGSVMIKV